MKKVRKINSGAVLISLAAAVNTARWVGVFTVTETAPAWLTNFLMPVLGILSGLCMGIVMAAGIAFIFHRLGGMQPFTPKGKPIIRFWGAMMAGVVILAASVYLLYPWVLAFIPSQLTGTIGNKTAWSVASVLAADMLIVALALVDKRSASFTDAPAMLNDAQHRSSTAPVKKKPFHRICECGRVFDKHPQYSGHCRVCVAHHLATGKQIPDPRTQKEYAVQVQED